MASEEERALSVFQSTVFNSYISGTMYM